jgi:hypothetical protein
MVANVEEPDNEIEREQRHGVISRGHLVKHQLGPNLAPGL